MTAITNMYMLSPSLLTLLNYEIIFQLERLFHNLTESGKKDLVYVTGPVKIDQVGTNYMLS